MTQSLASIALLVRDYDEAIAFFTVAMRFALLEDVSLRDGKRWVRVAPAGSTGASLLLAKAATPEQVAGVGRQGGGRVMWFLETDDLVADRTLMLLHGVHFRETPRHEPYGTVVVFEDLYGNPWDLIQRRPV